MAASSRRIAEDLRGVVIGEVLDDDIARRLYATDGSLYEITPAAVVRPRVTDDVAATVRYAASEGVPVHARGGGSGLAGGCLGGGIVIDLSRYMRRVVDDAGDTVRVQAGLVHADLNRRLATRGRVFGPDPAMTEATTLGGVAAVDSSGSRRPVYGSARDHVLAATVVLADGEVIRLGAGTVATPRRAELERRVRLLLESRRDVIREHTPRGCVNTSGYALDRCLPAGAERADLLQLLLGSEGTLGVFTELTVRASESPARVGAVLLTFPSLEIAAEAVAPLRAAGVASCDLIDRRRLSLARELDPRFETLLPGAAEAVLSVEVFAETDAELAERTAAAVGAVRGEEPLAAEAIVAETTEQLDLFGQLSRRMVSAIHGLRGVRRAVPGIEDIALPPAALPQFFRRLQDTLKRRQVTATVCGHVGHGQLHFRPLLDLTKASDVRQLETLAAELYDTVWLLGGSMSGEHGDGLARTPFTSRQHGPLVNVFREVRSLLDPAGLLNPGKVTPVAGARMTHAMRRTSPGRTPALTAGEPTPSLSLSGEAPEKPIVELQLEWSLDEAGAASDACHGCGACRTTGDATRMCPIFRYTPREEASPRAKANLVRGVLSGDLPAETLLTDEAKEVADLCVNCHQCRLDCPAGVDIPGLMLEAKSAYVATNGLRWDAWWTARVDTLARMASGWPTVTNALLRSRLGRWTLERTTGLAAGRKLPPIAGRPYLRQAASRRLNRPAAGPERLYYFVDTYANHFDTLLATALERIARRHGVGFYAPGDQQPSGMALLSQGALEEARRVASRNVARLAEAVRDGYAIVATEPSAVLAITHEYPRLLPEEEDARLVAASTYEACHYLWRRHQDARLQLDLAPLPITVAHHTPCHVRALGVDGVAENLLRLIPELRPVRVEKGCSGMAGTFGLTRRNYRSSLRAGLPLLSELRSGRYDVGATECGACRTQMEQAASIPTIHPVKLLAASYGVLPELEATLTAARARAASGRDTP